MSIFSIASFLIFFSKALLKCAKLPIFFLRIANQGVPLILFMVSEFFFIVIVRNRVESKSYSTSTQLLIRFKKNYYCCCFLESCLSFVKIALLFFVLRNCCIFTHYMRWVAVCWMSRYLTRECCLVSKQNTKTTTQINKVNGPE